MSVIKSFNIVNNSEIEISYNSFNSINCPYCNTLQRPIYRNSIYANNKLYLLCYCEECKKVYISEYECESIPILHTTRFNIKIKSFTRAYPNDFKHSTFDDYINSLSPMFIKVYDQSLTANSFGLDEIAGMGFRKALEFLVKDYAISLFPSEKDKIEKMHLSDVIDKINYQPITEIAKPCIKVLNDETHYFRKFEKVEVDNINKLILAIVGILSAKALASEIVIPNDPSSTQQVP